MFFFREVGIIGIVYFGVKWRIWDIYFEVELFVFWIIILIVKVLFCRWKLENNGICIIMLIIY